MRSDTQTATDAQTALRQDARGSATTVRPVTFTALRQTRGSGYSREFVRESVLAWAARRWPELFFGHSACEPTFESRSERSHVRVTSACNGRYTWSFKGIRPDANGTRDWETRVLVLGDEDHDLVGVSTGYLGEVEGSVTVGQPAFLNGLIEHLPFDDGGYPVCTVPRQVFDERALVNLQDHLLSDRRALPIMVVGSGPSSSEPRRRDEPQRLDARTMARQLCGLAHVVCLGPMVLSLLATRLGGAMEVGAGEARMCLPAADAPGHARRGHRVRDLPPTRHFVAGDIASAAQSAAHEWSVSPRRRTDFHLLWAAAVGA